MAGDGISKEVGGGAGSFWQRDGNVGEVPLSLPKGEEDGSVGLEKRIGLEVLLEEGAQRLYVA